MKSKLLIMAALCAIAFKVNAQTKGTNTLGFGVNMYTAKNNMVNGDKDENKQNSYSISYGHFIKDNAKIGFELIYSKYSTSNGSYHNNAKNYGGNLNYQKYFPLVKTLYAYAGGRAGYLYGKQGSTNTYQIINTTTSSYSLGAYGGITWFLSKTFAFETSLLSADASYSKTKQDENITSSSNYNAKNTSFNINSQGSINNLGFKIYILF